MGLSVASGKSELQLLRPCLPCVLGTPRLFHSDSEPQVLIDVGGTTHPPSHLPLRRCHTLTASSLWLGSPCGIGSCAHMDWSLLDSFHSL